MLRFAWLFHRHLAFLTTLLHGFAANFVLSVNGKINITSASTIIKYFMLKKDK